MTIDYNNALSEMRLRRTGSSYAMDSVERYQARATTPATQYTLGAMQEVDPNYTRVSLEEGNRVALHIKNNSTRVVTIKHQGSVPLNTHIRKANDVDMLVINEGFFNYSSTGSLALVYGTYRDFPVPATQEMADFRKECESLLISGFYAANVDTTGEKAIKVSGGSVVRKVDIVPANWYYGNAYQISQSEVDKEIQIYNKVTRERPRNHPFKFMAEVERKDRITQGGAKKAVRLLKNIKNDSNLSIENLSSYDITSLIWNMPNEKLNVSGTHDLAILGNTQAFLSYVINRVEFAVLLDTPDGSRKVLDTSEKFSDLVKLSREVDRLAESVYGEALKQSYQITNRPSLDTVRQWLEQQRLAS